MHRYRWRYGYICRSMLEYIYRNMYIHILIYNYKACRPNFLLLIKLLKKFCIYVLEWIYISYIDLCVYVYILYTHLCIFMNWIHSCKACRPNFLWVIRQLKKSCILWMKSSFRGRPRYAYLYMYLCFNMYDQYLHIYVYLCDLSTMVILYYVNETIVQTEAQVYMSVYVFTYMFTYIFVYVCIYLYLHVYT